MTGGQLSGDRDPTKTWIEPVKSLPKAEDPSTGTIVVRIRRRSGDCRNRRADVLTGQDGVDQINGYGADDIMVMAATAMMCCTGAKAADNRPGGDGDDILHGEDR